MPNWCFTSYVFEGDRKELKALHKKLLSLNNPSEPENSASFGKLWLGNVVELFGGDSKEIRCRGELSDITLLDDILKFDAMTAWAEMNEVWDLVMSKYKSLRYFYSAEEPGDIYYCTNDSEFKYFHRYLVDQWTGEINYCNTKEEVLSNVSERIGMTLTSWEMMEIELDKYNEANEENHIYIHEFEIAEE
jgi:hypothetical protein